MKTLLYRFATIFTLGVLTLGVVGMAAFSQDTKKPDEEWKVPARAAKKKNPIPADSKSIARGKTVYTKECQSCHGDSGRGDGPKAKEIEKHPGNLADPKMWDQTNGALYYKTTEGKKPMPAFDKTLKADERWDVVNYMRTLAPKPKKTDDKKVAEKK